MLGIFGYFWVLGGYVFREVLFSVVIGFCFVIVGGSFGVFFFMLVV